MTTMDDEDKLLRSVALQNANSIRIARQRAEQRSEAALREQASLLNLTHDSIFVRGMDDVITYWNRGAEELYGWPVEAAVGKVSHELTQTIFPAPLAEINAELLRTGRWEGEIQHTKRDGTRIVVASRWSLQTNERQRPLAILETNNDITHRKQAETLLAGEKRLLEMIARGDSCALILDALCRLFEEVASGSLSSILLLDSSANRLRHGAAPSLPMLYTEAIDGIVIGPSVGSCGTAAYRAEPVIVSDIAADPLWADFRDLALAHDLRACWSTPILSSEGRVLGTFATYYREPRSPSPREHNFIEQITHLASIALERERAEEALRQAQVELAHMSRVTTMGELTASLAHEVNQPLSAVVANGNACLRWLSANPPNLARAREAAERIVRDGKDAGEIVRRVRALFKRTAGEKVVLDLNEVIGEVLRLLRSDAARRSIIVETDLDRDLPPVIADRIQLQQVLLNLVLNGIEAMDPVLDRAKRLVIRSARESADAAIVEVRDHGVGMNHPEKAFEAFFTTKENGMGMGLAICRSIIDAHHGRLWVAPCDGPGARLCFTIPLQSSSTQ
jgi:PAS domain S-box-containing protein